MTKRRLTITTTEDVYCKLSKIAKESSRSISNMATLLLEQQMKEKEKDTHVVEIDNTEIKTKKTSR